MRLESKKYLRDIEQAAGLAGEFLTGRSFHDYASTPMLRAAVEGEYRRIIAFRNILIHGYAEVDHRIVWEVATVKIPALAAEVRALLGAAEPPGAL